MDYAFPSCVTDRLVFTNLAAAQGVEPSLTTELQSVQFAESSSSGREAGDQTLLLNIKNYNLCVTPTITALTAQPQS